MKTFKLILLTLLIANIASAQSNYQGDVTSLLVDFDPSYMKKYEYNTHNDYIVEESHINYHIPLTAEKTLILKVQKSEQPTTVSKYTTLSRKELQMTNYAFVERVNYKGNNVYLNIENKTYKVAYAIFKTMNDTEMAYYAPPHFSFQYSYINDHFPGGNIKFEGEKYTGYNVRHYYHGTTEVAGIQNDVLLKMYNDACYNRDYGVTTPLSPVGQANPYLQTKSSNTGKPLYRSCQHPIQSEYLKGIGLYKEFYQEGETVYSSELIAIDDIPINQYLQLTSSNQGFAGQIFSDLGDDSADLVFKSGKTPAKKQAIVSENIPGKKRGNPASFQEKGISQVKTPIKAFVKKATKKAIKPNSKQKTVTATSKKAAKMLVIGPDTKTHTVQEGETLYRLSKKYNTTVSELKEINNLVNNTIIANQKLVVRAR
jgi:LysM repeat protein